MYKLTESNYIKKMKEYKETFIYSKIRKHTIICVIFLIVFIYILFNGVLAYLNIVLYANNGKITNEEILDLLITICAACLTLGATGTIACIMKIFELKKENNILFQKFIEK